MYISLPGRLMAGRRVLSKEQEARLDIDPLGGGAGDCADGVLQTTSAGSTRFDRTFQEALVRPGPGDQNWVSAHQLSGLWHCPDRSGRDVDLRAAALRTEVAHLERLALRLDGFASLHASFAGGSLLTRPLRFAGTTLSSTVQQAPPVAFAWRSKTPMARRCPVTRWRTPTKSRRMIWPESQPGVAIRTSAN